MEDFPFEKTTFLRKLSEREMIDFLAKGPEYAPIRIQQTAGKLSPGRAYGFDAIVDVTWQDRRETFVVEMKSSSQPLIVDHAALQADHSAKELGLKPMVFLPYLNERALSNLESRQVSGIDMVGNAVILGDSFRVWRSGAPNPYRESRPIQNPYAGDSSIFARCFLLQSRFQSLTSLRDFALSLYETNREPKTGSLQLGTASKVVQALVDELILAKDKDAIFIIDPRRLLSNLERRYRRLQTPAIIGKSPLTRDEVWTRLSEWQRRSGGRYVATGSGSAGQWGALFGEDRLRLYVDDLRSASEALQLTETRAFPNVELIEERKGLVYFDTRREGPARWASMIQTWLELAQASSREQAAATPIYRRILASFGEEEVT